MHGLTRTICESALNRITPAIEYSIGCDFKRGDFHVVVANPLISPGSLAKEEWMQTGIFFEMSYGDVSSWDAPFDDIARSKAYLSWQHQMPTQHLQSRCPYLLQSGDTVYYGSAVEDRLVVAVSGFQPYFDAMVSEWMLSAIRAEYIHIASEVPAKGHFTS